MHEWETSKPQVYLNARQQRLPPWKNCMRPYKTLNCRRMNSVSSGTWSVGSHGRVPCRAKVPRRPHWSSVCHTGEEGGCIRSSGGEQASGKRQEEDMWEDVRQRLRTLAGHQGRGSQNSSGSCQRTGGTSTSKINEGPNQTGTGNSEKKKTRRKFQRITRQFYFKPWKENGAEPPWLCFWEYEGQKHCCKWQGKFPKGKMCQIDPITSDEASGSVDEGSAADTIPLTLAGFLTQSCLSTKQSKRNGQD